MQREEPAQGFLVPASSTSPVEQVVAHYCSKHPRARPGAKERRKICARLSEGWSVADLCRAIDGNHVRPFNVQNRQHSLELCMRDSSHVEMYLREVEPKSKAANAPTRGYGIDFSKEPR